MKCPVPKESPNTYGLYRSTPEGKRIEANLALMQITGHTDLEAFMDGNILNDYLDPEDRKRWQARMESKGIVQGFEVQYRRPDGKTVWVHDNARAVRDKKGRILYYDGVVEDITERKRAEEEKKQLQAQLIHSAKMAGIGTLSSGIAHEFNNLLQIMSGYVQFAEKTKKPEDIKEAFDIVLSTTDRASKIIQDLLTFSRTEETKRELCSIKEPLESVLFLTEDQLKKNNIMVVREYGRTSQIKVNKGKMQQVFLNVVTNARDAMLPRGGRLEIGIRQEKGQVKISFHDTGKGVRKEDLGRVFEPFYTTKGAVGGSETIAGTGLGLSVSYGIVKRHGGVIEVESKGRKGTTFTIKLPVKRGRYKEKTIKEGKKTAGLISAS